MGSEAKRRPALQMLMLIFSREQPLVPKKLQQLVTLILRMQMVQYFAPSDKIIKILVKYAF